MPVRPANPRFGYQGHHFSSGRQAGLGSHGPAVEGCSGVGEGENVTERRPGRGRDPACDEPATERIARPGRVGYRHDETWGFDHFAACPRHSPVGAQGHHHGGRAESLLNRLHGGRDARLAGVRQREAGGNHQHIHQTQQAIDARRRAVNIREHGHAGREGVPSHTHRGLKVSAIHHQGPCVGDGDRRRLRGRPAERGVTIPQDRPSAGRAIDHDERGPIGRRRAHTSARVDPLVAQRTFNSLPILVVAEHAQVMRHAPQACTRHHGGRHLASG